MSWQDHLAEEQRKRAARRERARERTEARRRAQAGYVRAFLPRFAEALRGAGDTYNQSAPDQVKVNGPRKGEGGDRVDIAVSDCGFAFQDSGKGFVRIDRYDPEASEAYAFLAPVLNRAGDLVGWQEKQVFPGGKSLGRNLDTLTEYYLMQTIRRRLLAAP